MIFVIRVPMELFQNSTGVAIVVSLSINANGIMSSDKVNETSTRVLTLRLETL